MSSAAAEKLRRVGQFREIEFEPRASTIGRRPNGERTPSGKFEDGVIIMYANTDNRRMKTRVEVKFNVPFERQPLKNAPKRARLGTSRLLGHKHRP